MKYLKIFCINSLVRGKFPIPLIIPIPFIIHKSNIYILECYIAGTQHRLKQSERAHPGKRGF